ncbi:hypothetical protein RFF05_14340 [Bengtsoniella intestinalis]|uniref:hypothetical protein n=1 Tax=Bengtsoniella intestinalis TaxID=3073143 RepID=UPI00391FA25D
MLAVYTHSTEAMQRDAARKIDSGIAKVEPTERRNSPCGCPQPPQTFTPYKGKIRKSGTGCVSQISDHLWEGRYSPKWIDGKRKICTTYAKTEAACEEQLATLIVDTKAELQRLKVASQ